MTLHPEPPSNVTSSRLLIRLFHATWSRIHGVAFGPMDFSTSGRNRFDAPHGEFGCLYVGLDEHCAFIETFGHATGVRFVTESELSARAISTIHASRPLRMVDLRGEGLARIGADSELTRGSNYELAQRWARWIHDHPRRPDGIVYRARHDPRRTRAAIFNRAEHALTAVGGGSLNDLSNASLLAEILDTYAFGLVSD